MATLNVQNIEIKSGIYKATVVKANGVYKSLTIISSDRPGDEKLMLEMNRTEQIHTFRAFNRELQQVLDGIEPKTEG